MPTIQHTIDLANLGIVILFKHLVLDSWVLIKIHYSLET